MYREDKVNNCISFEFSSCREKVYEAIDDSRKFLDEFITETEAIGIKVLLRELLMNAVVHGNRFNKELLVKCAIERVEEKRFRVSVEDEGKGFDHRSLQDGDQDFEFSECGRGYLLIKRLSDRIQFNDKGNRVTVHFEAMI